MLVAAVVVWFNSGGGVA